MEIFYGDLLVYRRVALNQRHERHEGKGLEGEGGT